jgi:hypothetical protein
MTKNNGALGRTVKTELASFETRERNAEPDFLLRETGAQELPTWKGKSPRNRSESGGRPRLTYDLQKRATCSDVGADPDNRYHPGRNSTANTCLDRRPGNAISETGRPESVRSGSRELNRGPSHSRAAKEVTGFKKGDHCQTACHSLASA